VVNIREGFEELQKVTNYWVRLCVIQKSTGIHGDIKHERPVAAESFVEYTTKLNSRKVHE